MMMKHVICAHDYEGIFMTIEPSNSPIRRQCLCSLYPEIFKFWYFRLNFGRRALTSK